MKITEKFLSGLKLAGLSAALLMAGRGSASAMDAQTAELILQQGPSAVGFADAYKFYYGTPTTNAMGQRVVSGGYYGQQIAQQPVNHGLTAAEMNATPDHPLQLADGTCDWSAFTANMTPQQAATFVQQENFNYNYEMAGIYRLRPKDYAVDYLHWAPSQAMQIRQSDGIPVVPSGVPSAVCVFSNGASAFCPPGNVPVNQQLANQNLAGNIPVSTTIPASWQNNPYFKPCK